VIELTDPVTRASLRSADGSNATLELGPVGPVVAQDLVPGPGGKDGKEWGKDGSEGRNGEAKEAGLIAGVAVRSYLQLPDTFARVVVRLRTPCHQKVRVAGRRVYLDLVPVQPPAPAAVLAATNSAPAADSADAAYRVLEADGLRRARTLASQANVKALEALRNEVVRRDGELGRKRPEMVSHLVDEIDRYTDEARALRLKLDGLLFRKQSGDQK